MILSTILRALAVRLEAFSENNSKNENGSICPRLAFIYAGAYFLFGIQILVMNYEFFFSFSESDGYPAFEIFCILATLFMIVNTLVLNLRKSIKRRARFQLLKGFGLVNASLCLIFFLVSSEKMSAKFPSSSLSHFGFYSVSMLYSLCLFFSLSNQFKKSVFLSFLFTTLLVGNMLFAASLLRGSSHSTTYLIKNLTMNISSAFCIFVFLLDKVMKKNEKGLSRVTLSKLLQQSPTANVILRKDAVFFSNDVILKFLGIKQSLKYEDLLALRFDRYIKVKDRLESPILVGGRRKATIRRPTMLSGKSMNLRQVIEILKRSPDSSLTFYTKITRLGSSLLALETEMSHQNQHNITDKLMTDGVCEFGTEPKDLEIGEKEEVQLEMKVAFLDWEHFEDEFIVLEFNDVTNAQIIKENEKESEFKLRILNSFSHELRTPLNSSKGILDCALEDASVPEAIKERYLRFCQAGLNLLEYLITDIIDFLKIETSQLYLDLESFSLGLILQEVIEIVKTRAEEKKIELKLEPSPEYEKSLYTDRTRLKRILINIILYCIKYTKLNRVVVTSKEIVEGKSLIIVQDLPGFGSSEALTSPTLSTSSQNAQNFNELEKDFGIFVTKMLADELRSHGVEGLTCDLTRKGWNFSVVVTHEKKNVPPSSHSDPNFYLSLEPTIMTMPQNKKTKNKHNISNLQDIDEIREEEDLIRCPRVLIVDDDYFNILSMEMLLAKFKISCLKAHNGEEALEVLLAHNRSHMCQGSRKCTGIAVVFMDLQMPIMDGFECAKRINELISQGDIAPVTVIACTANDSKNHKDQAKKAGMARFIEKPLNVAKIQSILSDFGVHASLN